MQPYAKQKEIEESIGKWDFILTKDGGIKQNSIVNVEIILENDPNIYRKIAYNTFTFDIELVNDINLETTVIRKGIVKNDLEPALLAYIEKYYGVLFTKQNMTDALVNIAHRYEFNPVVDYFNRVFDEWDGVERIPEFFPTYLGVPFNEVTTLTSQLWLVGAVAKTFEEECKFDFVLDLVGGQGTGKTTILQKLGMNWYTDSITDLKDKDNFSIMLRSLIVNDDEMVATQNSKFEEIKKFVTAVNLEFRKPFDRRAERYPKNFIIARTTNEEEYLKDKTGERRFLPLFADPNNQLKHPARDLTQEEVDLIWGEAVNLYRQGFSFSLTREQESLLSGHRERFQYKDDIEQAIDTYLEILIPRGFDSQPEMDKRYYIQDMMQRGRSDKFVGEVERDKVSSSDLAYECFGKDITSDRRLANKIKYIMDNKKDWEKAQFRVNGVRKRGYRKK